MSAPIINKIAAIIAKKSKIAPAPDPAIMSIKVLSLLLSYSLFDTYSYWLEEDFDSSVGFVKSYGVTGKSSNSSSSSGTS